MLRLVLESTSSYLRAMMSLLDLLRSSRPVPSAGFSIPEISMKHRPPVVEESLRTRYVVKTCFNGSTGRPIVHMSGVDRSPGDVEVVLQDTADSSWVFKQSPSANAASPLLRLLA